MERNRHLGIRVAFGVWLVLACAAPTWSEDVAYDRLLMLELPTEPGTQALASVEIGADGFQVKKIANVPSHGRIVSVVPGAVVFFEPPSFCFVDTESGSALHATQEEMLGAVEGDVGGGRALVLMPGLTLRVVDLAARAWRDVAPDPEIEMDSYNRTLSRFTPSPDGKAVAFCVRRDGQSGEAIVLGSQFDVYICDAETGATVANAEVRWRHAMISSIIGRGPAILWLDGQTALTFNRSEDGSVIELVRLDAGTGAVRTGPALADIGPNASEPRPMLIPGTPLVEIAGAGKTMVFDPRTNALSEGNKDRGFHLAHVADCQEIRYGERVLDRGNPLRPLDYPNVSPDGRRAVWTVSPLEKGADGVYSQGLNTELWYYDVGEGKKRLIGIVPGCDTGDLVWARSSDLESAAPPPKPARGWQPLEVSSTPPGMRSVNPELLLPAK